MKQKWTLLNERQQKAQKGAKNATFPRKPSKLLGPSSKMLTHTTTQIRATRKAESDGSFAFLENLKPLKEASSILTIFLGILHSIYAVLNGLFLW